MKRSVATAASRGGIRIRRTHCISRACCCCCAVRFSPASRRYRTVCRSILITRRLDNLVNMQLGCDRPTEAIAAYRCATGGSPYWCKPGALGICVRSEAGNEEALEVVGLCAFMRAQSCRLRSDLCCRHPGALWGIGRSVHCRQASIAPGWHAGVDVGARPADRGWPSVSWTLCASAWLDGIRIDRSRVHLERVGELVLRRERGEDGQGMAVFACLRAWPSWLGSNVFKTQVHRDADAADHRANPPCRLCGSA